MATRVAKHWKINPNIEVTEFNLATINKDNLVNQILLLKQSDIDQDFIMTLFGTFNGESLCHHYDTFEVPIGAFVFENKDGKSVSNTDPFITTFGIWVFNVFYLRDFGFSHLFGGYMNENLNKKALNNISQQLVYAMMENKVDTERYKQFLNYLEYFMPFETVLSPSHSEKLLTCTKEINKRKKLLVQQYKKELEAGDPVITEKIEQELIAFAKEYLKDDPGLDPYLSGAGGDFNNDFKNQFIMKGAIRNPDPNAKQEFGIATSSYMDGITAEEYSTVANNLAGGAYSRAKKTEAGGYWENLIRPAFSNILIDAQGTDCGTTKYQKIKVTKDIIPMIMYSYMVKPNGQLEELTSENINQYIGKEINIRSILYCKNNNKMKICHKCAGNFFYRRSATTTTIGLAVTESASSIKTRSMKAFHDSTIKTTTIDPIRAFNL